jgi:tRNA threonylcarbamoyladenosine biosynthesis protein TsaB
MKILAVDTATSSCSVAIIRDDSLLAELTTAPDETHSRHLMTMVDVICRMAGYKIADIDGFAVTIGPGSFTGLRIGISTIKAIAFGLKKPVVGVSSLEALAWQCVPSPYLMCPLLDARKNEVYHGQYRSHSGKLMPVGIEQVASLVEAVRAIREPSLFVGNAAELYQKEIIAKVGEWAHFATKSQHTIRASSIAWLGRQIFCQQETDPVESMVPRYVRKSDAEITAFKSKNLRL